MADKRGKNSRMPRKLSKVETRNLTAYRKCPKPEPDIFAKSDACNECEKHLNLDVVVTIVF